VYTAITPARPTLLLILALLAAPHGAPAPALRTPPVEHVKVELKASGFEPAEVMRDAGRLRVTVLNQSGAEDLTFVLIKATGEEVYRGQPPAKGAAWSQEFNLARGRYVLNEVNHPDWHFYINML